MNIKDENRNENGIIKSLCYGLVLFASYVIVFYFLWEGILAMAGAK
jgi:hypothetical protein